MSYIRKAKITVFLDGFSIQKSKEFIATEDEIYAEAASNPTRRRYMQIADERLESPVGRHLEHWCNTYVQSYIDRNIVGLYETVS